MGGSQACPATVGVNKKRTNDSTCASNQDTVHQKTSGETEKAENADEKILPNDKQIERNEKKAEPIKKDDISDGEQIENAYMDR